MRRLALMLSAAIALSASVSQAQTHDPTAILRAAKAAAGGAALDKLTGSYEAGAHGENHYKTWLNYRHYGMRSENTRDGKTRISGFNGRVSWRVDTDGRLTVKDDPATLREAITTAYASNGGYFYPDRFPARFAWRREEHAQGEVFDALEVEPKGGRAFELWFDRKTHLLSRIVDPTGDPPTWVELRDFKKIGPGVGASGGVIHKMDGTVIEEMHVGSVEYRDVPESIFDPPQKAAPKP